VRSSLTAGKKRISVLEMHPLDVKNLSQVNALSTIVAGRPAAEFGAPFREQNGLGSGSARDFGMEPAGCLFGIGNSYNN